MKQLFVCGRNSVFDLVENNYPCNDILTTSEALAQKIKEIISFRKTRPYTIRICSKLDLSNIVGKENHQGIVALIDDYKYGIFESFKNTILKLKTENKELPSILILDHIQDPHNLGAIIRTANALGIKNILISKDRACHITSTVLKVSSGGFINMNIIKISNIVAAIKTLKDMGYWVYSSVLSEKSIKLKEAKFNSPIVLIIGNEEKGVSKPIIKASDQLIYIEQFGTVQSLNASVAAGIMIDKIKNIK